MKGVGRLIKGLLGVGHLTTWFFASQILAGDAAVSGGVLPSTVSATEDADFQKRVQELCGCGVLGCGKGPWP